MGVDYLSFRNFIDSLHTLVQDCAVEILATQTVIPLKGLVNAWQKFALPGNYGKVVSSFRLELTEQSEIKVRVKTQFFKSTEKDVTELPWTGVVDPRDPRGDRVQDRMQQIAKDVFIVCPVEQIIGNMRDGLIEKVSLVKADERSL